MEKSTRKEDMQLINVANARLPTERAYGIQIMKMGDAFAHAGVKLTLVLPYRIQPSYMRHVKNIWQYYQVRQSFTIRKLPSLDLQIPLNPVLGETGRRWVMFLRSFSFAFFALLYVLASRGRICYLRDYFTLQLLVLTRLLHRKRLYFEAHRFPGRRVKLYCWFLARADGVITITNSLKQLFQEYGIKPLQIMVAPDGVDPKMFELSLSSGEAREKLSLPREKKIICYTGHLYKRKGVNTLVAAVVHLPGEYHLHVVGGWPEDVEKLRDLARILGVVNLTVTGYLPPGEVPLHLKAADILVLPNSGEDEMSRLYTSPLKLFEYLAAGKPIVASDVPAVREVLTDGLNAVLVRPDDPQALAEGIRRVAEDRGKAGQIVGSAGHLIDQYSWEKRVEKILCFISNSPRGEKSLGEFAGTNENML